MHLGEQEPKPQQLEEELRALLADGRRHQRGLGRVLEKIGERLGLFGRIEKKSERPSDPRMT